MKHPKRRSTWSSLLPVLLAVSLAFDTGGSTTHGTQQKIGTDIGSLLHRNYPK